MDFDKIPPRREFVVPLKTADGVTIFEMKFKQAFA